MMSDLKQKLNGAYYKQLILLRNIHSYLNARRSLPKQLFACGTEQKRV